MRVIGRISPADIGKLSARGISPYQAHEAILAEARRRHPSADTIIVRRSDTSAGFDILAL